MSGTAGITIFVVSIIAAIMLHEYGHFVTARWFGMRADRFFLGFGPTLWSMRRGETEYGVKALPLGGFVRIQGMSPLDERLAPVPDAVLSVERVREDRRRAMETSGGDPLEAGNLPEPTWQRLERELRGRGASRDLTDRIVRRTRASLPADATVEHAHAVVHEVIATEVGERRRVGDLAHRLLRGDEGRFFADRPAWQRAIVLVAGSTMHFVIAILVLFGAFLLLPQWQGEIEPVVADVLENSPADEAGLAAGDALRAVEGVRSNDYETLRAAIAERPAEPTTLVIARDGTEQELVVTPEPDQDAETGETVGRVGFVPTLVEEQLGAPEALRETFVGEAGIVPMTAATFEALGRVFGPEGLAAIASQATGAEERDAQGAVSLVGAAGLAGQTDTYGIFLLIGLIASINVFIGIFNLIPLPPLDGGHLAVLGVEKAVNGVRGLMGRPKDFTVDPRAVAAVAIPVLVILGLLFFALLWLDITDPVQLPG
jgi:regulator of sigma E protease